MARCFGIGDIPCGLGAIGHRSSDVLWTDAESVHKDHTTWSPGHARRASPGQPRWSCVGGRNRKQTRKIPRKLDRGLALSGFCFEATMSLQSGPWQSPTSSRGVPSLPRPKPRSIRNNLFSPEAEAPLDPRPHLGAEAPQCVPVRNRDPVQVGGPPEGFSPVTS